MPYATATLASTIFSGPVSRDDLSVPVSSTASITPGQCLYADRELMKVVSIGIASGINKLVKVQRGFGGTISQAHSAGQAVTIGFPHQFYTYDPKGSPGKEIQVTPHINVLTGDFWVVLGDDGPDQSANRWWSKLNTYQGVGSLGVRTETTDTIQPTPRPISVTQS